MAQTKQQGRPRKVLDADPNKQNELGFSGDGYNSQRLGPTLHSALVRDDQHRPYQVWRHAVGGGKPDELMFEESNELFWVSISKTLDGNFALISRSIGLVEGLRVESSKVRMMGKRSFETPCFGQF